MRGLFVGSGSDGLQHSDVTSHLLSFYKNKPPSELNVAYIGTATYDLSAPRIRQTKGLADAGCRILNCEFTNKGDMTLAELEGVFEKADIMVVSGGNTLFAHERWKATGVDAMMRDAAKRGCVMTGGSAGAICWFDGGHSDSYDSDSYKHTMLAAAASPSTNTDESSSLMGAAKPWSYIRVPCLGIFPGLVCPHADSTQSNGVLRMTDFDGMMGRHGGERGITIDHWAALKFDGEEYSVVPLSGKGGSVKDGSWVSDRSGVPGVWIKEYGEEGVVTTLVSAEGKISDLLRPAKGIVEDENCKTCIAENTCDTEL